MTDHRDDTDSTILLTIDEAPGADDLRSLHDWLGDTDGIRGRVGLAESPPVPGSLGPVTDGLLVALGPGGAVTALATTLVAWTRQRRSEVTLKVTRSDGVSFELSGKRIRLLGDAELRRLVDQLATQLDPAEPAPGTDDGPS
ncbi:hypothetical protein [Streptomyces sp. NPDC059215]|uniref:effector-associated constant component EACC1 n=1 Tax=Streptomyces sp. NPDC059215 TaxID=3346772 RepID=UPI00367AB825